MEHQTYIRGVASLKVVIGVFFLGLFVAGGAIMYGRMDQGQIDVTAAISNANVTRSGTGESQVTQTAPRVFQDMPNGGLVGKGDSGEPTPPPAPVEEVSASTSPEGTATSTDGAASEEIPPDVSPETPEEPAPAE